MSTPSTSESMMTAEGLDPFALLLERQRTAFELAEKYFRAETEEVAREAGTALASLLQVHLKNDGSVMINVIRKYLDTADILLPSYEHELQVISWQIEDLLQKRCPSLDFRTQLEKVMEVYSIKPCFRSSAFFQV